MRIGTRVVRGYKAAQFADAFAGYSQRRAINLLHRYSPLILLIVRRRRSGVAVQSVRFYATDVCIIVASKSCRIIRWAWQPDVDRKHCRRIYNPPCAIAHQHFRRSDL